MLQKTILLLSFVLFSLSATAKQADLGECSDLLSGPAPEIDYEASDLEGVFLHLSEKVQAMHEVGADRRDRYVRDILNMKAELLNRISQILPDALRQSDVTRKIRIVRSVVQILNVVGMPIEMFGLEASDDGKILVPNLPSYARSRAPSGKRSGPIGFVIGKNLATRDLPENIKRSIGFREHSYRVDQPPARDVGNVGSISVEAHPNLIGIVDGETDQLYIADTRIMRATGVTIDGHVLELKFNADIHEWVVFDKNTNNPSGQIGF